MKSQTIRKKMGRPLRVLHVTNVEASNYYTNNLVDHSDRRAVEYLALTFGARGTFVQELEQRGVKCFALDCLERHRYPEAARRLRAIFQTERIDLVHAHLFDPTLVTAAAVSGLGLKVVVTRHYSDPLHHLEPSWKRKGYLAVQNWVNRQAAHIIAPSLLVQRILLEQEQVPSAKVSLIPYGQTTSRFDEVSPAQVARIRAELGMDGQLAMVCVARLDPGKGHDYLFQALASLSHSGLRARLYLVGDGPMRESLQSAAIRYGIGEQVRFLGWRTDALGVIAAGDLVVHPSLHEALSSVVIEAVMLRQPLVVSDIGGARDTVGDNEYGMIVPPADVDALQAAIAGTVADLPSARARAARGRLWLLEYMDANRTAQANIGCYYRVAQWQEQPSARLTEAA